MRIAGITIPDKKRLDFGLTAIYGIGYSRAKIVLHNAHIDDGKKPGELSTAEARSACDRVIICALDFRGDTTPYQIVDLRIKT